MGKDYSDSNEEKRRAQGVEDGAPAYQANPSLYLVTDQEDQTLQEVRNDHMESRTGDQTITDYLALPEDQRVELIDGVFYDMAAPTLSHQDIAGEIFVQFKTFVAKNGGSCKPYISPVDVQLDRDDKTMVQPDVIVVCNRNQITKARIVGAPSLVVEVMSPSSRYMDTVRKLKKYKNAGVREYWVVFPEEQKVLVYNFGENSDLKSGKDAVCSVPAEYTFADKVPVGIWNGKCHVDFAEIVRENIFLNMFSI